MNYTGIINLLTLSVTFGPFVLSALPVVQNIANTAPTNKSNFIVNKKYFYPEINQMKTKIYSTRMKCNIQCIYSIYIERGSLTHALILEMWDYSIGYLYCYLFACNKYML